MNRAQRRRAARLKPYGNRHDHARIPKIILQDRDFNQIEILMMKLAKGEMDYEGGRYIMTGLDGDRYCVTSALEGWIDNFSLLARLSNIEYDDGPLVRLKNKLASGMLLTEENVEQARRVVDLQIRMYQAMPTATISSVATTTQIKLLQPQAKGAVA